MALTGDLERQGHVTLQASYLISGPVHARDMIFFVSLVCLSCLIILQLLKKKTSSYLL